MSKRVNKIDTPINHNKNIVKNNPTLKEVEKAMKEFLKQFNRTGLTCAFAKDDKGNLCLGALGETESSLRDIPNIFQNIRVKKEVTGKAIAYGQTLTSEDLKKAKEEFLKQFPGISCGFSWDDDGNKCLAVRGPTKKSLEEIPDIFNGIKVQKGVVGTITTQSE